MKKNKNIKLNSVGTESRTTHIRVKKMGKEKAVDRAQVLRMKLKAKEKFQRKCRRKLNGAKWKRKSAIRAKLGTNEDALRPIPSHIWYGWRESEMPSDSTNKHRTKN